MSLTVVQEGLNNCSGCEMALLNTGLRLLELFAELHFLHMPLLMDHKHSTTGEGPFHSGLPEADLGILSGGVRNEDHLEVALEVRKKCRIVVALGTCATHGGIPALINAFSNEEILDRCHRTSESVDASTPPSREVPSLLDRTYALDEKIKVDLPLPGCPPHPDSISGALQAILNGALPAATRKSVCDSCPTVREGKGRVLQARRFTENAEFEPELPVSRMRCLLEQGFMCMGPVTRGGCAGISGEAPRCILARAPCRGCYGPVKPNGNPLPDMLNALAGMGVDIRSIPDRTAFLRFSGAHRRLMRIHRKPRCC